MTSGLAEVADCAERLAGSLTTIASAASTRVPAAKSRNMRRASYQQDLDRRYNPAPMRTVIACLASLCCVVASVAADDDVDRAFAAVRVRAEAGDVVAQFSLGALLYFGASDTTQAVAWIRRAAVQGHAPAEFQMGQ